MFAGGAPPRAACGGAACGVAGWGCAAPRAPPPRAGGGPSGTTAALVIVASTSVRRVRLSHGTAEAVTARSRNALPIMVPPRAATGTNCVDGVSPYHTKARLLPDYRDDGETRRRSRHFRWAGKLP